jgi:hypothetical protein
MNGNARKYVIAGISVIALFIIVVLIVLVNRKPLDITGKYVLKIEDKFIHTYLTVTSQGDEFRFNLENEDGLKAIYTSKKMISGNYVLTDFSGDNKVTEYRLDAEQNLLQGTVNLLPLGKIKIVFEKLASSDKTEK